MTPVEYQRWLNTHGETLALDGKLGPSTRAAGGRVFTNPHAPAVSDDQVTGFAQRLGCSVKQLRAVAAVESAGGGFDNSGRPKILFERHIFWRLTEGRFGITVFSNPDGGGYDHDSWDKLWLAVAKDVDAAFASCSWGKFQVLGTPWFAFGFTSPLALAYSTVETEAAHYDLLVKFIEHNDLQDELWALSSDPATCRDFARQYNGKGYAKNRYDEKLAEHMR